MGAGGQRIVFILPNGERGRGLPVAAALELAAKWLPAGPEHRSLARRIVAAAWALQISGQNRSPQHAAVDLSLDPDDVRVLREALEAWKTDRANAPISIVTANSPLQLCGVPMATRPTCGPGSAEPQANR